MLCWLNFILKEWLTIISGRSSLKQLWKWFILVSEERGPKINHFHRLLSISLSLSLYIYIHMSCRCANPGWSPSATGAGLRQNLASGWRAGGRPHTAVYYYHYYYLHIIIIIVILFIRSSGPVPTRPAAKLNKYIN